ncbi:hypothetical protein ACS0TY_023966 [Phlomoides rotata]
MVRNVKIDVNEHTLEADPFVLEMKDFGIILGMDWLSKYRVDIKCHERRVILHTPTAKETTLYGVKSRTVPQVVSTMKTMKMLRKDKCMGLLVNIVGSQEPEVNIADVPIVREYQAVFPEELPGIPPNRQMEFTIDLTPGAAPVSKAPYRISPKGNYSKDYSKVEVSKLNLCPHQQPREIRPNCGKEVL